MASSSLRPRASNTRAATVAVAAADVVQPGQTLHGQHNVPSDATAAVLNVTATGPDAGGYFTVYPSGSDRPGTSNLNFAPGQTVPNHATTPLGTNGAFDVYNFSGDTQVVADLFGYFRK